MIFGEGQDRINNPQVVALAYAKLYDQRGGAVEIEIKEGKQGLGITRRSKKKFAAQQMVMLLGTLAHNVPVWARAWLQLKAPRLSGYGALRMARDVLGISRLLELGADGTIAGFVLNQGAPQASYLPEAFRSLLLSQPITLSLGKI